MRYYYYISLICSKDFIQNKISCYYETNVAYFSEMDNIALRSSLAQSLNKYYNQTSISFENIILENVQLLKDRGETLGNLNIMEIYDLTKKVVN